MLDNLNFKKLTFNSRKQILFGQDTTADKFIKIQIIKNHNKLNDLKKEYDVIKHLNEAGSNTCPKVYEHGFIKKDALMTIVDDKETLQNAPGNEYEYMIQDYVPDDGSQVMADILLTLIEQKKLGVYQGDVKPDNIRFDASKCVCYFIDYDQAIMLNEDQKNMSNPEFIKFCSQHDKDRHGFGDWLRHFDNLSNDDVAPLFKDGALDLSKTTVFGTQNTTNTPNGIYHTITGKDVFIDGSRNVTRRAELLDQVDFSSNEKVLDVGCNSGLLSMYLNDRGCQVTGVDNDPHIIISSNILSNIQGDNIQYDCVDLDYVDELPQYDTIMLFSVFHHTRNPVENAKKISKSCNRIILETRLFERGQQPVDGVWTATTNWSFNNLYELKMYCESLFTDFKLSNNLGMSDKNRYILEFIK